MLTEYEEEIIRDSMEGWELVDFLDIPISQVLIACAEFDWITEENLQELLERVGVR